MISKNNQNLIVKYLVNQATSQELDELELLLRDPVKVKEFNSFVKTKYLIEFNLKKFDADKTKKKLDKNLYIFT